MVGSSDGRPEGFHRFGIVMMAIPGRPTVDISLAREANDAGWCSTGGGGSGR